MYRYVGRTINHWMNFHPPQGGNEGLEVHPSQSPIKASRSRPLRTEQSHLFSNFRRCRRLVDTVHKRCFSKGTTKVLSRKRPLPLVPRFSPRKNTSRPAPFTSSRKEEWWFLVQLLSLRRAVHTHQT